MLTMLFVYILSVVMIIAAVTYFLSHRKNSYSQLYAEAIRNENNGNYKTAINNYKSVMVEILNQPTRRILKGKVAEKIKTLESILEYESRFQEHSLKIG